MFCLKFRAIFYDLIESLTVSVFAAGNAVNSITVSLSASGKSDSKKDLNHFIYVSLALFYFCVVYRKLYLYKFKFDYGYLRNFVRQRSE